MPDRNVLRLYFNPIFGLFAQLASNMLMSLSNSNCSNETVQKWSIYGQQLEPCEELRQEILVEECEVINKYEAEKFKEI